MASSDEPVQARATYKVHERSEGVTKCGKDDCRKVPAAPTSLSPPAPPGCRGVHAEVGLGPAVPSGG